MPFTTKEITCCTNETAKGANKAPRNLPYCFFILCFTVSITSSINTPESSNDFMVLIKSFISSFKINNVNPFTALAAPFSLIFLLNLFIALKVKLLTNPGKLSLAKLIATFFLPKYTNQEPNNPPD